MRLGLASDRFVVSLLAHPCALVQIGISCEDVWYVGRYVRVGYDVLERNDVGQKARDCHSNVAIAIARTASQWETALTSFGRLFFAQDSSNALCSAILLSLAWASVRSNTGPPNLNAPAAGADWC